MKILLIIAIIIVLFPYVAGPIVLWINGSRIPPTKLEEADPASTLAPNAESHFWKTTYFFSSNGFEKLGNRVRESNRSGLSAYKQLWRHAESGEIALVGTFLKESDETFCLTFVGFLHERGNGAMLSTSNYNPAARTLLEAHGTSKITVPFQDLGELRTLHQAHVAMYDDGSVRPFRVRDGFALCKQLEAATRTIALATKRFRLEGDTLRITPWGAVFSIWINLPPLKWIYEREERQLLEKVYAAGAASGALNPARRAA